MSLPLKNPKLMIFGIGFAILYAMGLTIGIVDEVPITLAAASGKSAAAAAAS